MPLDVATIFGVFDRIEDDDGNPVPGGSAEVYEAGGSTPRAVYFAATLSGTSATIVYADSAGWAVTSQGGSTRTNVYTGTGSYKLVIKNASGVTIATRDNIPGALDTSSFDTTSALPTVPVSAKTDAYTITTNDRGYLFNCNPTGGTFVLTLPSAVTAGDNFTVGIRHNGTANQVTLAAVSLQNIRGPGTPTSYFSLVGRGEEVWLTSDGADWIVTSYVPALIRPGVIPPVLHITDRLTAAPSSPTAGARYIVNGSPTGTWSSLGFAQHDIAEADGNGSWIKYTPANGWLAYVSDETLYTAFYASAWNDQSGMAAAQSSVLGYAVFADQKADGTVGGTATTGAWTKRTINTTLANTITGCSLASSVVTLTTGSYLVWASAYQQRTNGAGISLLQGASTRWYGLPGNTAIDGAHLSVFAPIVVSGASDTIELDYYAQSANTTSDLGAALSLSGNTETYAIITILSLSSLQGERGEQGIQGPVGPAGPVGSCVSAATNLFPDSFFDLAKGDKNYVVGGKYIYRNDYSTRVWVPDFKHSFGVGAWLHQNSVNVSGYACHFLDLTEIGTDDTVSLGMIFKTAETKNVALNYRFFSGNPSGSGGSWVGSSAGTSVTGTGGEDLIKIDSVAVPAGATGVYFESYSLSSADYHVIAVWCNLNAVAGVQPPPRRRRLVGPNVVRADAGDLFPMQEEMFKQRTVVGYSSRTVASSATWSSADNWSSSICGGGEVYETPGSLSFNAIRVGTTAGGILRYAGASPWYRCKFVVRTHATDPALAGSTVVAVGEAFVDPDATSAADIFGLTRDPITGLPKTITQADLLARFSVMWWPVTRDGLQVASGMSYGTSFSGLTRVKSVYSQTDRDPLTGLWSANSGNPVLCVGLEMLADPTQSYTTLPRAALSAALGVPPTTTLLTAPAPWEPVLPPRLYAMVGREANVYLRDMHSGEMPRAYDVTCSVGKQQRERWTATPVSSANDVAWSVNVMDADHGAVLGTASALLQVGSTTAAAGATRRVLCIGDSMTQAGRWTQRMLDIAAANASATQITLIGTVGTGSNKHEGKSGWTTDIFYQSDSYSAVDNPFVTGGGNKFDLATYLTATSQLAPHIVVWHLGINDVFAATTDAAANTVMDGMIDKLQRMIGVTTDAAVGSVIESYANAVNIIALPISPVATQDGFDAAYGDGQTRWRHKRNITICAYRLKTAFGSSEASRIYLVPWNVTVDAERGFEVATAAGNSNTAITATRPTDGVHPNSVVGQVGGYEQMGDAMYACINWLVATGRST